MPLEENELAAMFLRIWTKTLHPLKGVTVFPDYGYLLDLSRELTQNRLILIPKSRQMLISWLLCSLTLFRALEGGMHLLLSKNQFSADELLRRIGFIFDYLPEKLKLKTVLRSRRQLEISGRGRIISLPATEDAPRMHSPASVFWDEMAFTPYADKIWSALKPCLDNGARFTGVSTPNGAGGIFYDLVRNAPGNGFKVVKVHWRQRPDRDDNWVVQARKGLSPTEWRREYEISFEGSADLVYPEFTGRNVLEKAYICSSRLPVFRAIDFGYRHPYVLWIQETLEGGLVVFDELKGEDLTVEQLILSIRRIDKENGVTEDQVVFTACDPAGAAVDANGVSPVDRLKQAGFKLKYRPSRLLTGIELIKSLLQDANGEARLKFSPQVKHIISDFRQYRWKPGGDEPEKDGICDHSLDALRYFAVNYLYAPRGKLVKARVIGINRL